MDKILDTIKKSVNTAKLQEYKTLLEKELDKYPITNELETRTKVPKAYIFLGLLGILALMIIFDIGAKFLVNVIGFVYPAYSCFKAIESPEKDDDVQWLTYWIINSFFQLIEYFSDILLFWVPFYYVWKVILLVYLYAPQTKGAMTVYNKILKPFMIEAENTATKIANYSPSSNSPTSPTKAKKAN